MIPLSTVISLLDNDWLTLEVADDEILQAIKQISHLKALGPDAMHAIVYQKCWIRIFIVWSKLFFIMVISIKNLITLILL